MKAPIVSFLSIQDMTTQPTTYHVEANGVKYAPMVLLQAYTAMQAERDRAIRQRDHAGQTAHAWYVYFLSTGEHVMDNPDCPESLNVADDDGWNCQSLSPEEETIIGCPPRGTRLEVAQ